MAERFEAGIAFGVVAFNEVKRQLTEIRNLLYEISGNTPQSSRHQQGMDSLRSTMSSMALSLGEARNAANSLLQFGGQMTARYKAFFMDIMNVGSQFQNSRKQFELVYGDQEKAAGAFAKTLELAEKTSLSTLGVLQGVPMMQRRQVDALKSYEHQMMRNGKLENVQLSRLELINDLIAGSGQRQELVWFNLNMALGGLNRNFKALFDGVETEADRKAYKAAKTAEERMEIMSQIILKTYAGTSAAVEGTYGFIMANLTDVMQNIKGILGEELGNMLADGTKDSPMQKLLDFVQSLKNDEAFLASIRESFKQIASYVAQLVEYGTKFASWVRDLVVQNPGLVKLAIIMGGVLGVFATFVGKIGMFAMSLQSIVTFLLPSMLKLFLVLGAAAVPLLGFFSDLGKMLEGGGLAAFEGVFERIQMFASGVFQLVTSYKDGVARMSGDTADSLKKAGLFELVVEIGGKLGKWKEIIINDIWPAIKQMGTGLAEALKQLLPLAIDLFKWLAKVIDSAAKNGVFSALAGTIRELANAFASLVMTFGALLQMIVGSGSDAMQSAGSRASGTAGRVSQLDATMIGLSHTLNTLTGALKALAQWLDDFRSKIDPTYRAQKERALYGRQSNTADFLGWKGPIGKPKQIGTFQQQQYSTAQQFLSMNQRAKLLDTVGQVGRSGYSWGEIGEGMYDMVAYSSPLGILDYIGPGKFGSEDNVNRRIKDWLGYGSEVGIRARDEARATTNWWGWLNTGTPDEEMMPTLRRTGIPEIDSIWNPQKRLDKGHNMARNDPRVWAFTQGGRTLGSPGVIPVHDEATSRQIDDLKATVEAGNSQAASHHEDRMAIGGEFAEAALGGAYSTGDAAGGRP